MINVDVRMDGSEKVNYDYDGYWAYVRQGFLSYYPNHAANSHWHEDLELMYILSGSMDYNVNGEIIPLSQGNGILVNSKQLHYGFSPRKAECRFLCILLHPMLLCATQQLEQDYVSPVLSDNALPYIYLDPADGEHRQINLWQKAGQESFCAEGYAFFCTLPLCRESFSGGYCEIRQCQQEHMSCHIQEILAQYTCQLPDWLPAE